MRMRKVSAEENDAAQPFFFDDLARGVYLICLFLYSLNNAGVFLFSHNLFNHTDHVVEEHVVHAFYQNGNRFGIRPLQVSGTVVRYVIRFGNDL